MVEVATSVVALHAHLVPAPVLAGAQPDRMEESMGAVCADVRCEVIEFNGEANHLHLLVAFPRRWRHPRWSTAQGRLLLQAARQGFPEPARHYWRVNAVVVGS